MRSLEQWLAHQSQVHPQAIDLGLARLREVLERLDWRQPSVPVITVAGTNGKGSVTAYCAAILRAAGYRVGTFTSPHLRDYRERIRVDVYKRQPVVTRFKGLGEMNPLQLRETTMAPQTRRLVQMTIDAQDSPDQLLDMLLAKKRAGDRRVWLESKGNLEMCIRDRYVPTSTPSATAAKYYVKYVIAGSTLEDVYTRGLEGDVVARSGNTLTVRGSTVQFNDGTSCYNVADAVVILGPSTIVTADDNASAAGLDNTVAVGQHIIARGIANVVESGVASAICSLPASGTVTLDATGSSATNTGSVRLISTNLWGPLVSSGSGSVVLNVQTINNWPVADFAFAGNGLTGAATPVAANFVVDTGALTIPDTTVGDSLWIDGLVAPFASAPPDFNATAVNSELSVQMVGAATGTVSCGQGVLDCTPASLRVSWSGTGTSTPFATLTATGMSIDLANAKFSTGVIRIGPESIDLKTLPASPQIVLQAGTGAAGLPAVFTPLFSFGNPLAVAPAGISVFSVFGTFETGLTTALATTPALQFEARGTYDRATNTFSASSVNVVL